MYSEYDQLVSVSHQLTELNRIELAEYAPADRFRTVRNFPDVEHVVSGARRPLSEFFSESDAQYEAADREIPPRPAWYEALQADEGELRWFVTVGRLSPEKNHARLIRSFGAVHRAHPEARLLIVGGGPLQGELQRQIDDAGLSEAAFLTGAQRNPYALLAASDCFVLSSLYEGQPMVLIEAAICGLPIVSTSFGSVYGALPQGAIRIVEQDDDALAAGMTAVLDGEECITLVSVEPRHAVASVAQRPGARHSVTVGAPGKAILAQLAEPEWPSGAGAALRAEAAGVRTAGYATSHDEVIPTVQSVAVPLVLRGQRPAAIAVVHVATDRTDAEIAARLQRSAATIRDALGA
ncbi:MAG: hypothetical protein B7X41_01425 [Microbacterium sp. 14-71-5]|nr:MAG: hypothetical protein B7X41_01425 [Microbacterium sp. 14-71-5]